MNFKFYKLTLKDGTTVIGTKGMDRTTWAVLFRDGTHWCLSDKDIRESELLC